jgi:demethylmenaquinone methyltransferase/2-methoxy-6-polyprenyl-1,4-benzoquinol methylase
MWSSQKLLPGFPLLEAKLDATAAGIAPFRQQLDPQDHALRAIGWFQEAWLGRPRARTFAGEAHAPLSASLRAALESLLQMRWQQAEAELEAPDRRLYRRLCLPDSPDFILNLPDYYAFFTYSMFSGTVRA